jgi:hypothetical protein
MNVILSVRREGEGVWRDLELPADRPLADLLPVLRTVVGHLDEEWELLAGPPVRRLEPGQSLAEAGVWSGAWLLLRPVTAAQS